MPVKPYASVDEAFMDMANALGFTLTQWQVIELKLYQLFIYLCGQSDRKALDAIFHEMPLEVRMKSITELIRIRDGDWLSKWDAVSKTIFKDKRLRDKIAHWTVGTSRHRDGGFTSWLSPPSTDEEAQKVLDNIQNAIGADDLRSKALEFQITAHAVHQFMTSFPEVS